MLDINPMQLLQMRNDPLKFAKTLLNKNPNVQNADKLMKAIEMYKNGNNEGLKELANEVCNNNGTTSDLVGSYIKNQYGIN